MSFSDEPYSGSRCVEQRTRHVVTSGRLKRARQRPTDRTIIVTMRSMQTFSRISLSLPSTSPLRSPSLRSRWPGYTTPSNGKSSARQGRFSKIWASSDSDDELISPQTREAFAQLQKEIQTVGDPVEDTIWSVDAEEEKPEPPTKFPDYRIPHSFIGFDPRRMDLEDFPRLRTDFDGKRGGLIWTGTECQRCGLQIRRERRTNRETSLNVYANPGIPDDFLRHCPERKTYPVLWRSRDPYVALDILGVQDY